MKAKVLDIPVTFWGLVESRVGVTPDAPFLEDEHGTSLSFAAFRDAAERVAAGLLDLGIGRGSVVGWQLPTAIDSAVLMAALSRLGAIQVPILPILREREVTHITRQSRCDWLLVCSRWRGFDYQRLAEAVAAEVGFAVLAVDSLPEGGPSGLPTPPTEQEARERHWLYYTSGSTAEPKGVWHRDASAMAASSAWIQGFEPTPDDLFPMAVPFTHIAGVAMTTTSLRTGMRLMLMEAFDPQEGPLIMAEHGATLLGGALPLFLAFLAAQRAHGGEPLWPRLRVGINGGASKPAGLHREVKDVLGGIGVMGAWGLTEFPVATCGKLDDTDEDLANTEGVPGPGVEIRVVGLDGEEKGPGEEGELRLRGPQMFLGYADPTLDVEAMDEQGFLRTGDLGLVSESKHVTITGRVKDIIIRNAENISALEVEECLYQHPAIADVAIIGLPDPRTGERACAVVSLAEGHKTLTLGDVAAYCRQQGLASQKIPEQLEIVDEVPRNAMGKIEKASLRAIYTRDPSGTSRPPSRTSGPS